MKLFSFSKPSTSAADATPAAPRAGIVSVRGDAFFTRRLELPAGTAPEEVAGFVELQLEELAPFPLDQLYHGHVRAADGSAVFLYAAYKRGFTAEQTQSWPEAVFVLPDFVSALQLQFNVSTVVLVRSDFALTALYFDGDHPLPVRAASRPLAADAPPDVVARVRGTVLDAAGARTARDVTFRVASAPAQHAKGLAFTLQPEGSGAPQEVFIATADCWPMDVRDAEFIAEKRKRLGFDIILWRVVQGAAALLALLLAGEVIMLGGSAYVAWLDHRVVARNAEMQSILDKQEVGTRLDEFGRSGIDPFAMLTVAAGDALIRGRNITLTNAAANKLNTIEISGNAPNVAAVNAYEAALKAVPQVENVNVSRRAAGESGATFTFVITFRPDAIPRPVARTAGDTGTVAQGVTP